jgi:hypothetical protein
MSLPARLLNVFAVPGEVFAEVRDHAMSHLNWLAPALLGAVVGVVSVVILFSQPAIQQQVREQQAKAIEQQVKAGKLTQEQADQALSAIDKFMGPTFLKIAGGASAVVVSFVRVVWWGLVLMLLARWFLKVPIGFGKSLEVSGLATMVGVLGAIVALLLTVNLNRMGASPSLSLVVKDFDLTRKSHLFLGAANVFSFWQLGVTALGLAKLAGVPFIRAALAVFAFWVLQECILIQIGFGQFAL